MPPQTHATPWQLSIVYAGGILGSPERIRLRTGPQTLGRTGDIVLGDASVSTRHALLEADTSALSIRNLATGGGTLVNGVALDQGQLRAGDVLGIGETIAVVTREDEEGREQAFLSRAATSRLPVIIEGETGSGKDVLARALHQRSRRPGPFVPIDCTTLPSTLAESELFGHARGAFSGATNVRQGLFLQADKGTILLDEIADMPLPLQPKLLRVLETRCVRPVGADRSISVDVRVIAATHVSLVDAMRKGRFRKDLYARLDGRRTLLRPLRARRSQILTLFSSLAHDAGALFNVTRPAAEWLLLHDWPHNVRGLKMLVARAVEDLRPQANGARLLDLQSLAALMDDAAFAAPCLTPGWEPRKARKPRPSRSHLIEVLRENTWNITRTARALGRRRELIHRWIKEYGVRREEFEDSEAS